MTIYVPGEIRRYTGGKVEIHANGASVRNALEDADRRHPGLLLSVCDETGAIRPHVNVFVNGENIKLDAGLGTPLSDRDTLHIIPAISGG